MLFMLLLNSVQSLTVLTFCAQWMALAALLLCLVIKQIAQSSIPHTLYASRHTMLMIH